MANAEENVPEKKPVWRPEDGAPMEDWPDNIRFIWEAQGHPGNTGRMRLFAFFISNSIAPYYDVLTLMEKNWPGKFDGAAISHMMWLANGYKHRKHEVMKLYTYNVINAASTNLYGKLVDGHGNPLPESEQWIIHMNYDNTKEVSRNRPDGAPRKLFAQKQNKWREATEEDDEDKPWFQK